MRPFFSSDCRTECNDPSGTFAASARTAAFASTCLFASILARSAPSTALWRALSSGVGAVGSKRRCVGASIGSCGLGRPAVFSVGVVSSTRGVEEDSDDFQNARRARIAPNHGHRAVLAGDYAEWLRPGTHGDVLCAHKRRIGRHVPFADRVVVTLMGYFLRSSWCLVHRVSEWGCSCAA
jgi:hypothetical protein